MNSIPGESEPARIWPRRFRAWGVKLITLILAGMVLGYCYQWAAPRLYRPETRAGFWLGAVHGFLMPAALPSLLAGNDVPIFAINHTGRDYKLGYICGINLCGLVFFGLAFRPQRKTSITSNGPPAQ